MRAENEWEAQKENVRPNHHINIQASQETIDFQKTEEITNLQQEIIRLNGELAAYRKKEAKWLQWKSIVSTELSQIQENYVKYAHYYSEYYNILNQLEEEKQARKADQREFQLQTLEILKEFQPFQDYFEQADRKKNQLKVDVTQFLKTLKIAMVKMQSGGVGAAHWTLGQEQQESS